MARLSASGTTCPRVLQRGVTALRRALEGHYDAWQEGYPAFKERLGPTQRARLKQVGQTLWRFDLRFRWAIGITSVEFDDRVVTRAAAAPTRQGYFLLMRLVDLWFSLDLAFDMYAALHVSRRVQHPNVLLTIRKDAPGRLRALRGLGQAAVQVLDRHLASEVKRRRLVAYLEALAADAEETLAGERTRAVARAARERGRIEPDQLLGVAQAIRNRYVHGGETASTGAMPAQEKIPFLRLLTGCVQTCCLALAVSASEELVRQLHRQVGIR